MIHTHFIATSVPYDVKFGVEVKDETLTVLKETFTAFDRVLEASLQWEVERFCALKGKHPVYSNVEEWQLEQTTRALLNL